MEIRIAVEADMQAVYALNDVVQGLHARARPDLYKAVVEEAGRKALFEKARTDADWRLFVADLSGVIAGYVATERIEKPDSPFRCAHVEGHIHHICVRADQRRSGVGRALATHAADELRRRGVDRLTVSAWAFNEASLGLFRSIGFAPAVVTLEAEV